MEGQYRTKDGQEGNQEVIDYRKGKVGLFATSNTHNFEKLSELRKI